MMRAAMAPDSTGSPWATTSMPVRGFSSAKTLRRHQVVSLEPSSEEELHLLDLLHSRLSDSLQSLLLPSPDSKTLTLSFLHKLLDSLLACESDFKSLLLLVHSRNPSLASSPQIDRAALDLFDRAVKSMDLCNAVSLCLHSLRLWSRHADIAASALHRPSSPPQISRATRALSKLVSSSSLSASLSSCRMMCRICSAKRHLQAIAASFASPRLGESVLANAFHSFGTVLHFSMWALVASFPCSGSEIPPPPAVSRHAPWAVALAGLHDRIGDELRRERKLSEGMLAETIALKRIGREVLEKVRNGEGLEAASAEFVTSSKKLEEGLGPFERKVREVFHRLVRCREDVLRCLNNGSKSLAYSADRCV